MSEIARDNVSPEELARFDKLAARWWGEPDRPASGRSQPANGQPRMAGPAMRTMDGSVPIRRNRNV